jgi:uncharacterized protein (TIGR03000 family)
VEAASQDVPEVDFEGKMHFAKKKHGRPFGKPFAERGIGEYFASPTYPEAFFSTSGFGASRFFAGRQGRVREVAHQGAPRIRAVFLVSLLEAFAMRTLLAAVALGVVSLVLFPGWTPAQAVATAQPVSLEMNVPADASVWIDGQATKQQGVDRHFVSPPLQVGLRYCYDIRVQWAVGSKTLERSRRVHFQAGDQVRINLLRFDEPALDVVVARPTPVPAGVSPTNSVFETNPGTIWDDFGPSLPPGPNSGSLSGPPPGGFERN